MLKLEKITKSRELNILLRSKQTFFTITFLCALAYALLIHFGALLIFKIGPFQVNYQQSLFPPVRVATELPIQRGVYSNQHFEEEPIPPYILAPLPTDPAIPKAYKMIPIVNKESIMQEIAFSTPIFPEEIKIVKTENQIYELLDYHLSGAIAEISPIMNMQEKIKPGTSASHNNQIYRVHFNVQIDQLNGEIFWWEIKEGPESKKLRSYAIEMLKNLQFVPKAVPDLLSGEIEIIMTSRG